MSNDRCNYFIGIDGVWITCRHRVLCKKVVDQFDHQAMQARPLFAYFLVIRHGYPFTFVGM